MERGERKLVPFWCVFGFFFLVSFSQYVSVCICVFKEGRGTQTDLQAYATYGSPGGLVSMAELWSAKWLQRPSSIFCESRKKSCFLSQGEC